jgi:hypothetical protein
MFHCEFGEDRSHGRDAEVRPSRLKYRHSSIVMSSGIETSLEIPEIVTEIPRLRSE